MKKRLTALLLCLSLVFMLFPATVLADGDQKSYVALGDSITTGYGLTANTTNFANQVASSKEYTLTNLAQDGATSAELLSKLSDSDVSSAIAGADLITITIGGNDLMNALYDYLAVEYNNKAESDNPLSAEDIKNMLTAENPDADAIRDFVLKVIPSLSRFAESEQSKAALTAFTTNLNQIISRIKELNATATIIVINQYNPYKQAAEDTTGILQLAASMINDAFDAGVKALNNVLQSVSGCTVADVYTVFGKETKNPCNASFTGDINLDFHPNAAGHTLIAETICNLLPEETAPVITAQPSNQTVTEGKTATFTVAATGTGTLTYQWQQRTDNGANWTDIPGATNETYTITNTTAAMNGYQYRCVVTGGTSSVTSNAVTLTVTAAVISVTDVALDQTTLTLTEGQTAQLNATVSPNNATNKNVTWSSSAESVATVDANGNVTAIKAGTASITVTTDDGSKTAACSVTVKAVFNQNSSSGTPGTGVPITTGSSWMQSPIGWWYKNPDGSYPANQWKYLDTGKGYKAWYWFNQNGYITFGWQYVSGKWYYLNRSGEMQTGWQFVNNQWYYLDQSGAMATGWVQDGDTWYYMDRDGSMHFGWLSWAGYWYHLDSHGAMSTGWQYLGGEWYCLYPANGRMAADTITPDGYRVDQNGAWVR